MFKSLQIHILKSYSPVVLGGKFLEDKIIMKAEPSWTGSVLVPLCCHLRTQGEGGSLQTRREPSPDHADTLISDRRLPKL